MSPNLRLWGLLTFLTVCQPLSAAPVEANLEATFLYLHPGMKGSLELRWQGDPTATVEVYIDFNADGAWSTEEVVLDAASLSSGVDRHLIKIPLGAKIDFLTQYRLVVRDAARQVVLDVQRPVYKVSEPSTAATNCQWRPGFELAPPVYQPTAMAMHDDGTGAAALYVVTSDGNFSYLQKWGGNAWQDLGPRITGKINVLLSIGTQLYVGGLFSVSGINNFALWQGQTWLPIGDTFSTPNGEVFTITEYQGRLYVAGSFTQIGNLSANRIAAWDGTMWNSVGSGANDTIRTLKIWQSILYAGGDFTTMDGKVFNYIARYNGTEWKEVASGGEDGRLSTRVFDLEVFSEGGASALYAGIEWSLPLRTSVAKWNGTHWSSTGWIGSSVLVATYALETYLDGTGTYALYAGGDFELVNNSYSPYLARFSGNNWQSLGSSMNGRVTKLMAASDSVPILWVMGSFTRTPDGSNANYIARYDGERFTGIGKGLNGSVDTLIKDSPGLLVGGNFTHAGGVPIDRIGKWDGTSWQNFGEGSQSHVYDLEKFDDGSGPTYFAATATGVLKWSGTEWTLIARGPVRDLVVRNNQLYAGSPGQISHATLATSYGSLASWNGSAWQAIAGAPSGIYALVNKAGDLLFVGGQFTSAGGVAVANIARWTGTWSKVGTGFNGVVRTLALHQGQLYAGGSFVSTGDGATTLNNIGKWDGAQWSALGNGTNGPVQVLTSVELETGHRQLLAGGSFTRAGGQTANNLAAWDSTSATWHAFNSGLNGSVEALTQVDGNEPTLFVGGDFSLAGGIPSTNIARWACLNDGSIDVEVSKTSSAPSVATEQLHNYTVTVRGRGLSTAYSAVFKDLLDQEKLEECSWTAVGIGTPMPTGHSGGTGNEIDQTLTLPTGSSVTYEIQCRVMATARGTLSNTAIVETPGDSDPTNDRASVLDIIIPPANSPGDCDDNTLVEPSDREAIHTEIFDGDGILPRDTGGGTYPGHPTGCNANADQRIDAGDLACLDRLLAGQICSTLPASSNIPVLSIPNNLVETDGSVLVPVSLDPAGHQLHALAFSIHYDESLMAPGADLPSIIEKPGLDPNGILLVQHVPTARRIDITLVQPPGLFFPAGALIRISMTLATGAGGSLTAAVMPGDSTFYAGDLVGRSIQGQFILAHERIETLILTHTGRLAAFPGLGFENPESRTELLARLQQLANHSRVQGLVVDLATYPALDNLYASWAPGSHTIADANRVLLGDNGLIDIVEDFTEAFPSIKYLLIVGDDRIVPMARLLDPTRLPESHYTGDHALAEMGSSSSIGLSLEAGYFLSDDILASAKRYAASSVVSSTWRVLLPRLASGRLVENAHEILASIDNYLAYDGIVDLRGLALSQRQVQVTGYDFLTDSAKAIAKQWRFDLGGPFPPGSSTPVDSRLVGNDWGALQLLEALRNTDASNGGLGSAKILSLNGHASHWEIGVPESSTGLATSEIYGANCASPSGSELDLEGAIVLGMSCHGGLAVAGNCVDDPDHSLDLPQLFLSSGALAYGDNSGFGWGTTNGIGLGERLATNLHQRLAAGGSIGEVVWAAKQRYFRESYYYDPYDRKTLLQWTLYGFPMAAIDRNDGGSSLTGGREQEPLYSEVDAFGFRRAKVGQIEIERRLSEETPAPLAATLPDNLTRAEVRVDFTAEGVYRKYDGASEEIPISATCPGAPNPGCYYRLNGLTTDEADLPIQPFFIYSSNLSNTVPRESLWMGGQYRVEDNWRPIFNGLESSEVIPVDPSALPLQYYVRPRGSGGEPLPGGPGLGCLDATFGVDEATSRVAVVTGELLGSGTPTVWKERIFEKVDFESFYFGRAPQDCRPPLLSALSDHSIASAGRLNWRITTDDDPSGSFSSGVWRVVVVWDDEIAQRYVPVDLVLADGVWQGSLAAEGRTSIRYYVQAVDREGNVSWLNREVALPPSGVPLEVAEPQVVTIDVVNADLSFGPTPALVRVNTNQTLTLSTTVVNLGPTTAPAQFQWTVPGEFILQNAGAIGTAWTCQAQAYLVICSLPELPVGTSPPVHLTLLSPAVGNVTPYRISAQILNDANRPENNQVTTEIQVLDSTLTDLRVTGSVAVSGSVATFSFDIVNEDHDVNAAQLRWTFPAELTNIQWTCTSPAWGSCQSGTSPSGGEVSTTFSLRGNGSTLHFEGTAVFDPGPGTTGPVRIRAEVLPPPDMTDYELDNNIAEPGAEALVFRDGFESGDLSAWN